MTCFHAGRANLEIVKFIYKDKVIIQYSTSHINPALVQKIEILAVLADSLLSRSVRSPTKVFVKFENNYLSKDSTAFTLGYDKFYYAPEKNDYTEWTTDSGIVITIRDRSFSIAQALKLINWAVAHEEIIKKCQSPRELFTLGGGTVKSIPYSRVAGIVKSNDTVVNSITRNRQEQIDLPGPAPYPKYFYQDDKFHIAYGDTSERALPDLMHVINFKHADYLAFINDSTFFYKSWPSQLKGPFIINGFKNIGLIEYDCLVADSITSSTKITINITFGMNQYATKALFIPSLNKVISRYDSLESYYLDQLASPNKTSQDEGGEVDLKTIVLYVIIILSLALNIFLILKRRN